MNNTMSIVTTIITVLSVVSIITGILFIINEEEIEMHIAKILIAVGIVLGLFIFVLWLIRKYCCKE
jgi:hypothetical protein